MRPIFAAVLLCLLPLVAPPTAAAAPAGKAEVARYAADLLDKAYPDANAPGAALLVARGDEVLYRGARGAASVELGVPLTADHVFRIGSVTKQFAAAAVLKLAEDGKLSLDDPLVKFVPGYPGGDKVTVRMLLDHTSGIASYTGIEGHMASGVRLDLDTRALIDVFRDHEVDFAPGTDWRYNNSGYVLVGAVIEAASGRPWHAYLYDAILAPAGLAHTRWGDDGAIIAMHARGYTRNAGKPAPAALLSMTQPHAAGALVSTVDDLLRWNRALHGGRVLSEAGHRAMVTPAGKAAGHDYGYGIVAGELHGQPLYQHGGGIFGFASQLMYLPESELTVAVLRNSDAGDEGRNPGELARRVAAFALGEPYPEAKEVAVDPGTLASAQGVYRIDADNTRVLRMVDGELTSQRTGGVRHALMPIAVDDFLFGDGAGLTRMKIERDATGQAVAMRFFPNGDGEGERVPRSDEPLPDERARVGLDDAQRGRLHGDYRAGEMRMRVFEEPGRLMIQLGGQPAVEVYAESADVLYVTVVDATLVFEPGEAPAPALTLKQGGQEIRFERVAP